MTTPYLTSPLHGRWASLGARLITDEGWQVAADFGDPAAEAAAARQSVGIGDDSHRGKLLVQGDEATALGGGLPEAAAGYRLRPDLHFVSTGAAVHASVVAALESAARRSGSLVTVTDVTHGRFEFRLVGPQSPILLSKVCGLDFADDAFGDGHAAATSLARITALVIRADCGALRAYRLLGGRASGAYVWDVLLAAGREFDLLPVGQQALQSLQA